MLYSLESGLQKRFEQHGAYEMFQELKMVFQAHARVERYEVSDKFYSCKMEENSSVSEHILKMSGLHNRLSQLGVNLPDDSVIDIILQWLPPSYKSFVMNFNMQGMEKTIPELYLMLKSAEVEIKKEHQVLMVNKTTSFKKGRVRRTSRRTARELPRPVSPLPGRSQSMDPSLRLTAFIARETVTGSGTAPGNAEKKAGNIKGIYDIHVIDVYLTSTRSSSWVFDTGAVAHICNSKQEMRNKRRL